jgi:hypothetical protein
MSEKIQTISPTGKLNWDDSLELIPSGDCRERWHIEMSEVGKYGKLTNMRSDLNWDIELGDKEHVIGGCYDAKRDQYILVLSNEDHLTTARFVYVKAKATTPFYETDELFQYDNFFENFTSTALATDTLVSCKMIDDIIITVDGVNENKSFDIVKGKAVSDGTIKSFAVTDVKQTSGTGNEEKIDFYAPAGTTGITNADKIYIVLSDTGNNILYGGVFDVDSVYSDPYAVVYTCTIGRATNPTGTLTGMGYKYVTNEDFYHADDDSISMIVPTPRFAPEITLSYDVTVEDSPIEISSGIYQFAYSLVYYNNAVSLLSSFSKESIDENSLYTINGNEATNVIVAVCKIDRHNVKKIRLYARRIKDNVSSFYLIEEIDRDSISGNIFTYNYYGNASSISTGTVEALTIQDSIPYKSETVDLIKENRITLGGNTEGYEIIRNDDVAIYSLDSTVGETSTLSTLTKTTESTATQLMFGDYLALEQLTDLVFTPTCLTLSNTHKGYLYWELSEWDDEGTYKMLFKLYKTWNTGLTEVANTDWLRSSAGEVVNIYQSNSSGISGTMTTSRVGSFWEAGSGLIRTDIGNNSTFIIENTGLQNAFKIEIDGVVTNIDDITIPMITLTSNVLATNICTIINEATYLNVATVDPGISNKILVAIPPDGVYASIAITEITKAIPYSKGGFIDDYTHLLIKNMYDQYGRLKYVSDIKKINIPSLALEDTEYGDDTLKISYQNVDTMPSDAYSYSFAVSRAKKQWSQYLVLATNVWDATLANAVFSYVNDSSKAGLYAIGIDAYSIVNGLEGYTFQEGDSIRITAYSRTNGTGATTSMYYTEFKYKDVIKSSVISTTGNVILFVDAVEWAAYLASIAGTPAASAVYYVFEIYRDYGNEEDSIQFLECSNRYDIATYDVGTTIDIYTGTAITLTEFDKTRIQLKIKSSKATPKSEMEFRQYGKVIGRSDDSIIIYRNNVRNGGKSFQNTSINNLFRFDALDVVYLNDNYGTIKGLATSGNTLRVYQERQNASIYIGGTEMANQDGEVQIIRSDKVLGSYRYSQDNNYGLQCKTGMVNTGNDIYIWDLINGVVVRDSNGMMPIVGRITMGEYSNDFKMERFFKEKSKLVTSKADFKISLGYNRDNRTVFVTNSYDNSYPTICFSEEFGFWYQFVKINPQFYLNGSLSTIYSNAADDEIYNLYNDNNDRCEMTGVQQPFTFQVVGNDNGKMKKTFEALSVQASQAFATTIEIEPTASYKYYVSGNWVGMKSVIAAGRYRLEEGIYRAEILKNMYPDLTTYRLYNGELMRGGAALITFTETDSDEPIEVLAVDVSYSDSST